MNKKILFLTALLASIAFPLAIYADQVPITMDNLTDSFTVIGSGIIVIGWIVVGILYLTSAGSPEKTTLAKKALVAAIIGTVVIIIAATAQSFITDVFKLGNGTGSTSTSGYSGEQEGPTYTP